MSEKTASKVLTLEINGNEYESFQGQTVIEVADANNIYIPRFCYHKKLSVAANCRMCLVDIENARRPSPACATPVMQGMKVNTKSIKTLEFQKSVMEFLLINHPLDCPICDQGGECELQDLSVGYGNDISKYSESKRTFLNPDIGSLISTEMTRCIQCTRCVRFGHEIGGAKELGAMGRGDRTEIGTYISKTVDSEISGNMIDLCPVGALTSKPYRYRARPWELQQFETVSAGDGFGANIYSHVRRNEIMRTVPRENEDINQTWIADRDRFEYSGIYSKDRVKSPIIKKHGEWQEVSWEEALDFVKASVDTTVSTSGAESISAIASDNSTVEDLYLLQKLLRSLGSNNIDTRLRQTSLAGGVTAGNGLDCRPEDIEKSDSILLFGSNIRKEYPLLNIRVRKAAENNASIYALNSYEYNFNFEHEYYAVNSSHYLYELMAILKEISLKKDIDLSKYSSLNLSFEKITISSEIKKMVENFISSKNVMLLFGQDAIQSHHFDKMYYLFTEIKKILNAKGGMLSFGANAKGALQAGATPVRGVKNNPLKGKEGFNSLDILSGATDTKLLFVVNNEPEYDSVLGEHSLKALDKIDIVVAVSAFSSSAVLSYADIILPVTTHYESTGTFINIFSDIQSFNSVIKPYESSRPCWKLFVALARYMDLPGFDYNSTKDIMNEFDSIEPLEYNYKYNDNMFSNINPSKNTLSILPVASMYRNSALMRRAEPLQLTSDAKWYRKARISTKMAKDLAIDDETLVDFMIADIKLCSVNVLVDNKLPSYTAMVPSEFLSGCQVNLDEVKISVANKEANTI